MPYSRKLRVIFRQALNFAALFREPLRRAEVSRPFIAPGLGRDRYRRRPGARAQLGGEAAASAAAQARASAASSTATSAWSTAQAA